MRVIYKEGDVLNGFRLLGPAHDKWGGWNMICKVCNTSFVGRPKAMLTGKHKSCGCIKRQEAHWLDVVGFPEVLRLSRGGLSSSRIAKALGERTGLAVTKNMVLGVLSRRIGGKTSGAYKPKIVPAGDASDAHSCAFPLGNPGEPEFHFCHEALKEFGAPYCPAHMKIAYMPLPLRPVRVSG